MSVLMDANTIDRAFNSLAGKLDARGAHAQICIVGGAAMIIAFGMNRLTDDVDAVFDHKTLVYELAEEVAEEENLGRLWLNDAVKGNMAMSRPNWYVLFDRPGLSLLSGSMDMIMAMKVYAHRQDEDTADVLYLADKLGIVTPKEILKLAADYYDDINLGVQSRAFVEEIFGPLSDQDREELGFWDARNE